MSWKEGTSASTNLVLFGLTLDVNNLGPWLERECHDYPSMYVKYKASGFLEFPFDQQFNIFHHISTISELQDHVTTCLNLCKFYNYDYNTIKKKYIWLQLYPKELLQWLKTASNSSSCSQAPFWRHHLRAQAPESMELALELIGV